LDVVENEKARILKHPLCYRREQALALHQRI